MPLYIGKAETFGKGDGNLSANISDLATGNSKFRQWGYNYAYHIGDLSAATLVGHPGAGHEFDKVTPKYTAWRDALFDIREGRVHLKEKTFFWACLWGPESPSVWEEYGPTRLAFEDYLLACWWVWQAMLALTHC